MINPSPKTPTPAVVAIDRNLAELNTQLNQLEAQRAKLEQAAGRNRRDRLAKLYKEHGFASNDELIAYLRNITPRRQAERGLRHGRAFSPQLIEDLKKAIAAGWKAADVKRALGVSAPSFYIYKHKMGLTRVYAKRRVSVGA